MDYTEKYSYDATTGTVTSNYKKTTIGNMDRHGYLKTTTFDGRTVQVHRLAWFLYHGTWPVDLLDHINGDRTDNRITNLRECTRSGNRWNSSSRTSNGINPKGVMFVRLGRWRAQAGLNRKKIHIGYFTTEEEAAAAYREFSLKHHGEFSVFRRPDALTCQPTP